VRHGGGGEEHWLWGEEEHWLWGEEEQWLWGEEEQWLCTMILCVSLRARYLKSSRDANLPRHRFRRLTTSCRPCAG
jgi:hypothetical protein